MKNPGAEVDRGSDSAAGHEAAADIHERNAVRLDRHGAASDAARERRDAAVQRDSAQAARERDGSPDRPEREGLRS